MSARPIGPTTQQAAMFGGSPWGASLAALFGGLSAAGQPGGWQNFGIGAAQAGQNWQAQQMDREQFRLLQESATRKQQEFEAERRRANKEAADADARRAGILRIVNSDGAGDVQTASAPSGPMMPDTAGIPPQYRQSAILGMGTGRVGAKPGEAPRLETSIGSIGPGGGDSPPEQMGSVGSSAPQGISAILASMPPQQSALFTQYAQIDPEGAFQMLLERGFAEPKERRTMEIAGRLVDADTGEIIKDLSAEEISLRQASRPVTSINMPGNPTPDEIGRGEFAKANATAQAKYFDNVATAGAQAQTRMGDIDQLTALIELTPQGAGQEYLNKGAAILSRMGVDLGEYANVPAAQAFQSIVSRIAPTLRVAGSGATSDFEMQQFLASLPAIGNMRDGNRIIARNLKKITERSVQEAQIAAQVQGGDLTPAQGRKKILDLGPLNLDLPTFGGAPVGGPGGAPDISGGGMGAATADDPLGILGQ